MTLVLKLLHHPHTGDQIATALNECLSEWGINPQKMLLVVTDNGSNMVKAIRILSEMHTESSTSPEISDDEHDDAIADEDQNENAIDNMSMAFQNIDICGILTCGRRNRMDKSLAMRACLKLTKNVLSSSDFIM